MNKEFRPSFEKPKKPSRFLKYLLGGSLLFGSHAANAANTDLENLGRPVVGSIDESDKAESLDDNLFPSREGLERAISERERLDIKIENDFRAKSSFNYPEELVQNYDTEPFDDQALENLDLPEEKDILDINKYAIETTRKVLEIRSQQVDQMVIRFGSKIDAELSMPNSKDERAKAFIAILSEFVSDREDYEDMIFDHVRNIETVRDQFPGEKVDELTDATVAEVIAEIKKFDAESNEKFAQIVAEFMQSVSNEYKDDFKEIIGKLNENNGSAYGAIAFTISPNKSPDIIRVARDTKDQQSFENALSFLSDDEKSKAMKESGVSTLPGVQGLLDTQNPYPKVVLNMIEIVAENKLLPESELLSFRRDLDYRISIFDDITSRYHLVSRDKVLQDIETTESEPSRG